MKTYFATQERQLASFGSRTIATPAVLHEFETPAARDAWVAKGAAKCDGYRRELRAAEAQDLKDKRCSVVRHRSVVSLDRVKARPDD